MSSGTATPASEPARPQTRLDKDRVEAFIEDRLRRTRRQVKGVDVAGGLLTLCAGVLAYLLVAAVIDHWVVFGGLGFWGRLLLLGGLITAGGTYFALRVLPPLVQRINPIFAAQTIERDRPSLKNSLINFLLLRARPREMPKVVYRELKERAATDLSQVTIETAVDRRHVIRLGYLLAGLLAVCCLYLVLSPKNPLVSAARIVWPWANISAPTRVTIEEIKPGDVVAYHGDFIDVSAEVDGLADGEPVTLYYTTSDGQSLDQAVPMLRGEGEYRHRCTLPPGSLGLQQDLEYYLSAGDRTTPRFKIDVQVAPAILVDTIEYRYPPYTGIDDQVIRRRGDIRAIEGTRVTIRATANQQIDWAEIDLDCDGLRGLRMQIDGRTATGGFTLRLDTDDSGRPEHDSYQLRFADEVKRKNRRPIRHRIEVIPDLPPEIQVIEPRKEEVQLAEDGRLEIRVRAEDPDFALRKVAVRAEHNGRSLPIPPALNRRTPEAPWPGQFEAVYAFEPARLGLKAGDRVPCWAEAEDNKQPVPGRCETGRKWINIVGPEQLEPPHQRPDQPQTAAEKRPPDQEDRQPDQQHPDQDQPQEPSQQQDADQGEPRDQDRPRQQDAEPSSQGEADQQGEGTQSGNGAAEPDSPGADGQQGQQSGEPSDEPSEPIDDQTNPGDAFEEILEHRQEQFQQQQQREQQQGEQQSGEKGDGQQQTGQEQGDQQQTGQEQGSQQQNGQEQDGQPQTGQEQGGQPQTGQEQGGQPQTGQEQGGQPQTGQEQGGQPQTRQEQGGQPQTGQEQGGQPQTGQEQGGQQQTGQEQGGQPQTGQEQGGQPQTGQEQGGQPQTGQEQGGQPQTGQEQGGQPNQQGQQGGQPNPQQQSPGSGQRPSEDSAGSPLPQEDNLDRQKKPGDAGGSEQGQQDSAKSPSISPGQSDSQGDTAGDRSGGGQEGGGQEADQPGTGSPGSNTDAESGGATSRQQGDQDTGSRAGDQVESDRQTGKSARKDDGDGSGNRRGQPGSQGTGRKSSDQDESTQGPPQQDPSDGGRPGERVSDGPGARGSGNPTTGGRQSRQQQTPPPPETDGPGGDDPNLEYARKQTDLALEYLEDQLARQKPDPELLERLGWTREDLARFARRWEQMKQAAARQGSEGEAAQKRLDEAIKSLGLRPRGTELKGGQSTADQLRKMREAGRYDPPPGWQEWLKEYSRGIAGGGR